MIPRPDPEPPATPLGLCSCVAVVDQIDGGLEVLCGCIDRLPSGFAWSECARCVAGEHKNNEDSLIWDPERMQTAAPQSAAQGRIQ